MHGLELRTSCASGRSGVGGARKTGPGAGAVEEELGKRIPGAEPGLGAGARGGLAASEEEPAVCSS